MVNPSAAPVAISFRFTDQTGRDGAQGNLSIAPGEQTSRFVDELLDGGPAEFVGTLTIEASAPVGVTALRGTLNERLDFLLTTLPVFVPGTDPGTDSMLAHFADGGEWSTEVVAVNTTEALLFKVWDHSSSPPASEICSRWPRAMRPGAAISL
jgi:hypothetical protein